MLKSFESFKKWMYLYQTLFWILSWSVAYIIINGIAVFLLGVEYGDNSSSATSLFAFITIIGSLYIATKATKKFKAIMFTRWLSKNMDSRDVDCEGVLYKLVSKNLIEYRNIEKSELPANEKEVIYNFTPSSSEYKEAARNEIATNSNGEEIIYVVPNIYNNLYMIVALLISVSISMFALFMILEIFQLKLESGWILLLVIGVMVSSMILFLKKYESLKGLLSSKALMSVDNKGISYGDKFYEWENIILPDNLLELKASVDSRDPFIIIDFKYLNETVSVNLKSISALEVYDAILLNGIHFENN